MKKFSADNSKKQLLQYIEIEKKTERSLKVLKFVKYAAVLLVFLGIGYIYQPGYLTNTPAPIVIETKIEPGSDKARLTFEDGSHVELESGKTIQTQNVKSNGEELIYTASTNSKTALVYNYLTIPRGGQFHIKLADGTLVWLNSESRLKYPVAFIEGDTRNR